MATTLDWLEIATADADRFDGIEVRITGHMAPADDGDRHGYFLLLPEPMCCIGCFPSDPLAAVEVFLDAPIPLEARAMTLSGRWCRLAEDPAGWRYQLRDAVLIAVEPPRVSRRGLLAAGAVLGLAAWTPAPVMAAALQSSATGAITADLHSHAGRVIVARDGRDRPFLPLAEPMRAGGMALVALAVVADTPTHHLDGGRIRPFRDPAPGELYAWSHQTFARAHQLASEQGLAIVTDRASLDRASAERPSIVIAAEGADFLEGQIDRVDEAYEQHRLRHLQLVHYRPNELGDIQTEPAVQGGLTDFGAAVVRRCNERGLVVDVAHGTMELVKRAAAVTTKPLVLSHTSLNDRPATWTRTITSEHARLVAGTGGVIGIWPPASRFADMAALAQGFARMADVVGVDHVGLGTDMLGLTGASVFASYSQLPDLARALSDAGFKPDEIGKLLGGNYVRVLRASMV